MCNNHCSVKLNSERSFLSHSVYLHPGLISYSTVFLSGMVIVIFYQPFHTWRGKHRVYSKKSLRNIFKEIFDLVISPDRFNISY